MRALLALLDVLEEAGGRRNTQIGGSVAPQYPRIIITVSRCTRGRRAWVAR
jgi:hypothetical protein